MAGEKKKGPKPGSKQRKNEPIGGGIMRYSRARLYQIRGVYKKKPFKAVKKQITKPVLTKKKPVGGDKNGKERIVRLKREPRALDSEREKKVRKPRNKKPFSLQKRRLRPTLTPGTVVILLAGRHKGKRAVLLKQLASGLLLVTGPMKLNSCPLRRINQCYVIATKTKLDISSVKLPEHLNDQYFKRIKKDRRKKTTGEAATIFAEKKENYTVSDQRKQDQIAVDKQVLEVIRKNKEKKLLFSYLASTFSLKKTDYPHKMIF